MFALWMVSKVYEGTKSGIRINILSREKLCPNEIIKITEKVKHKLVEGLNCWLIKFCHHFQMSLHLAQLSEM